MAARDPEGGKPGLIGWVRGRSEGPLLLCVGGLHGNEPAGVHALNALVDEMRARQGAMTGDFVAVIGNAGALVADRRFLRYDLNRSWTPDRVAAALARRAGADRPEGRAADAAADVAAAPGRTRTASEDAEMVRVLELLEQVAQRARGQVHVLDLHTTSGVGGTFTTTADTLRHRRFAMSIPFPLVLGVGEHLKGTLLDYLDEFGYVTTVCECGQHREPRSVVRARAAIRLAVRAAGVLPDSALPDVARSYRILRAARRGLPSTFQVVHRHPVAPEDQYRTRPGFSNFQEVRRGDVIGDDRGGEVASPAGGLLLMPLYQELGEDGFFVIRPADAAAEADRAGGHRFQDWSAAAARLAAPAAGNGSGSRAAPCASPLSPRTAAPRTGSSSPRAAAAEGSPSPARD